MMGNILYEIIPDSSNISRSLKLAEQYGTVFEYNDFMLPTCLDDKDACRRKLIFYKSLGRDCSKDTLHGAFIDISVHSEDSLIRRASRIRVRQSMEIAQELGVRGVVFHTGLLASFNDKKYRDGWLESNVEFWTDILEEYPNQCVYMENMFDWNSTELVRLTKAMKANGRFGICLDYAHAAVFGQEDSPEVWFESTAPYIRHMHINDNDRKKDMHLPLGEGIINWKYFYELMTEYQVSASVLLEMTGWEKQQRSLEYLETNGFLK